MFWQLFNSIHPKALAFVLFDASPSTTSLAIWIAIQLLVASDCPSSTPVFSSNIPNLPIKLAFYWPLRPSQPIGPAPELPNYRFCPPPMVLQGGRKESQLVIVVGRAAGHRHGPGGAAAELRAMEREAVNADGATDLPGVDWVDMIKGR
jgi:hypothetical protein